MPQTPSPRARRTYTFPNLLLALLLLGSLPTGARAAETPNGSGDSRRPGLLAFFVSDQPRTPKPWHRYGDFYASVGVGPTFFSNHTDANDDGSLSQVDAHDSGSGWNLSAGFAGRYVGAEVGYTNVGTSKFDAVSDGSGDSWGAGDVSAKVEGGGWMASGLARIPIKPRWVLLARLGVVGWSTKETFTETFGGSTYTSTDEDSGTNVLYGAGFEYDIYSQDRFWLRTEMTRTQVDHDELPVLGVNGSLVFHY